MGIDEKPGLNTNRAVGANKTRWLFIGRERIIDGLKFFGFPEGEQDLRRGLRKMRPY